MFKKKNRLPSGEKSWETSANARFFILKVSKSKLSYSRFGFVVSKKIDKRAVVRNSLKRKIRSCLEQNFEKIKPGYNMLFLLKKEAVNKSAEELCLEVNSVLKAQKLL